MAKKMSGDESLSVMRRKAGAGRPVPEIGAPTAAKILRTALMQAGEDVAALSIVANIPEETRVTLEPVVDAIEENALMALLEGPDASYGLVILDTQALGALIEIQTTGRVSARPADARPPTRTDAIMCADFLDRTLELLETRAIEAEIDLAAALSGYRYSLALPEPRAVGMTLADIPYRRFSVGLDMGRGAKQGRIDLILPFEPHDARRPGSAGIEPHVFTEVLSDVVQETQAKLSGTLHRMEIPLSSVLDLTVGSMIPIPSEALVHVSIEDIDGHIVTHGRLGMQNGFRALRIGVPESGSGEISFDGDTIAGQALEVPPDGPTLIGADPPDGGLPDLDALAGLGDAGPDVLELCAEVTDFADLSNANDAADSLSDLPDLESFGSL